MYVLSVRMTEDFLTSPDGGLYNTYAKGGLPDAVTGGLEKRWELQRISNRDKKAISCIVVAQSLLISIVP